MAMKQLLCLILAALMLFSCSCSLLPENGEGGSMEEVYANAPLMTLAAEQSGEVRESPADKAYVRGGTYANMTWREINAALGWDTNTAEPFQLKEDSSANYTRRMYFTFNLSNIAAFDYNKVFFIPTFTSVDTTKTVDYSLYKLDPSSWSGETLTWNTAPQYGEVIGTGEASALSTVDLTEAVTSAIENGEKQISFVVILTKGSGENFVNSKECRLVATVNESVGGYVYQLVADETANQAIWAYAEQLYQEWHVRYEALCQRAPSEATLIESDEDEFSKTVYSAGTGFGDWTVSKVNKPYPTRTYDALDDLGDYSDYDTVYPFDKYGGWMDPSMRQEVTGYFYPKKIDGRWWFIDPLGYPCYMRTISGPNINYLSSPNQKKAALDRYGTEEKWRIATVRWLKDELGFNVARGIFDVEDPPVTESSIGGFASGYGSQVGVNSSNGGSTTFSENNTMPIFEPGFVTYADATAKKQLTEAKASNPLYTGFTTDNELPMGEDMLGNYLSLDYSKAVNHYSYAAAWTFMINMTGKQNPTGVDITDEISQLFRGFVYDRYFNVVDAAFEKYDPNHMNLGCRFLTAVKDAPWVLRFASLYLDAMTINWYGQWTPDANAIYAISTNADLPLMVTEFYTKALENDGSFDDPTDPLKNTRGAGWVVRTQQDRGDFYQNFTLRLLESKNFVGWQWHQYIDDDDSPEVIFKADGVTWKDQSNIDANKGIVNNWHEPYEELCASMAEINLNVYRLAKHFDAKYAAKNAE